MHHRRNEGTTCRGEDRAGTGWRRLLPGRCGNFFAIMKTTAVFPSFRRFAQEMRDEADGSESRNTHAEQWDHTSLKATNVPQSRKSGAVGFRTIACRVRSLWLRLSTVASAAAFFAGCEMGTTRTVPPIILGNKGSFSSPDTPSATPLLSTGHDGCLAISLLPGAVVELSAETQIRVDRLTLTKNGNRLEESMRRQIAVSLQNGTLRGSVQFGLETSAVEIALPEGHVAVRSPALFAIELQHGKVRVTSARGTLQISRAGESGVVVLNGPAFREWPAPAGGQPPAAFDAEATEEIEKLRALERKLLGLESRRRLTPYPWRQ